MRKISIKEVDPKVPGLVLAGNGKAYVMEEETHEKFFKKIFKDDFDLDVTEDNLASLCLLLMNEFDLYPYLGCSSGDRKYNGGTLMIKNLNDVSSSHLKDAIDLYSAIEQDYTMDIISVSKTTNEDKEVSIGEIYEELLARDAYKK